MCRQVLWTLLVVTAATAFAPHPAAGQDWREVTSFRQRSDEGRLHVHARYGAGKLAVRPGSGSELYRVSIRYDADAFDPVTRYEPGELEVGVEGSGRGLKLKNHESGEMRLWLSPDIPLDLDLDFGAVEAKMELGGLRLSRLDIETGASDTEIDFSTPNPTDCEALSLAMGAAAVKAGGLANANCQRVSAEGGVGDLTLEFTGEWRRDLVADLTIALGSISVLVPEDIGVRVDQDTFLANFSGSRFEKRGSSHYSQNWDTAERRLTIQVEGAFGTIDVRWLRATNAAP